MSGAGGTDLINRLLACGAVVAVAMTAVALAVATRQAPGVMTGAALSLLDLWAISLLVRGFFHWQARSRRRLMLLTVLALSKFGLIGVALYIIIVPAKISPLGVFLGLMAMPFAAGLTGIWGLFARKK